VLCRFSSSVTVPICIVGDPEDLTATYVAWLARRRGLDVVELREDDLGHDWAFALEDFRPAAGHVEHGSGRWRADELQGAFVRLNPRPGAPPGLDLGPQESALLVTERRAALHHFLDRLPCAVANRPSAGRSNGSKPFQMARLSEAGFEVPRWIATSERAAVLGFLANCPDGAVYKACSGLRSRVRRVDGELARRLVAGTTPVVVQEYVRGRDVRLHTVGDRCFATEVVSLGVDYRFETEGNEFRPTQAPPEIEELCVRVAASEGLTLAGFDFRVAPDGRWHCLEVNPVPTFLPYEMATGQPIGDAVLDVLVGSRVTLEEEPALRALRA
jgi:hypothetical protein